MAKKTKHLTREQPPTTHLNGRIIRFVVLAAGIAYLLAFFLTSLGIPQAPELTRGAIWHFLLIPDDLIAGWSGDQGAFAILDRLPLLIGACVVHACAFVVGWLALSLAARWRLNTTRLERGLVAHGLGLTVVSLWTLVLGLLGGLHQHWLLLGPMMAVFAATILVRIREHRLRESSSPAIKRAIDRDWLSRGWLLLAIPFAVLVVLGGMLPPVEFDVREYHLQAPKEFFQLGRIEFLPHNVYANMPLGAEMWSLAAMVVTGDGWLGALIGKTVIASLLPFTAAALYAAGIRLGSRTAGIVAAIVYIAFPWMLQVSMLGLIEGAVAHFAALAILVIALRQTSADERPTSIVTTVLAGFFAGSAAACKYPALLFVVAPIVSWIAWSSHRQGKSFAVRQATVALIAASVAFGPWLAKNWYFTGNPTYPLYSSVFGGATRTAENAAQWRAAHRPQGFGPSELLADAERLLLTSPWLSPAVWPLAGLIFASAWLARCERQELQSARTSIHGSWLPLAAFVGFVFVCWWCFTHRIDRFWLPAVPALALLAGLGAARSSDKVVRRCVLGLLGIGSLWSLLAIASPLLAYNRYFTPLAELRDSPERVDPWILELNRRGGRVLSIGEAAVFDFEHPVLYNTTFDPSWFARYGVGGATSSRTGSLAGFDKLVADHDLDYVYVDWDEIARYRSPGNYGFDERVTLELFEMLVNSGRLLAPLPKMPGHAGEVYPVPR